MHIVIDARIINTTTGTYVERLLTYLDQLDRDNHYTVLVPTKDLDFWRPLHENFTVRAADFKNYSFAEQWGFKKLLDSLHADLVHFCMPQQPILYRGAHVTTFHDLTLLRTYNSDKNWLVFHFKQLVGRFVFRLATYTSRHLITPTQYTKQDLMTTLGVPARQITVTYEAADVTLGTLTPYEQPFKRYLLYIGQQADYKNIRRLAAAHQELLKTHPDLGLILVGKKREAHLANEQYFAKHGYRNILFTDFVDDAQRDWLLTHAAVYVFPSLYEGFGLPGLEAMAYGAPVASSNATCLPEVYGDAAYYFDPRDTGDMARAINDILTDDQLRASLIEKGHAQVAKYSWRKMAEQTLAIYTQAVK